MARAALEQARAVVADFLGTRPRQVIFTSGATESINAAVFGALGASQTKSVAMAAVEHSAVRDASRRAASHVLDLPVDSEGTIDAGAVTDLIGRGSVGLVHCQVANHEVGTLQPFRAIADACRAKGIMMHVDAAAAVGRLPIDFDESGVDLMSLGAHKIGGPKGIGVLLVRRGLRVEPLIVGGDQERARRAGIENVAGAVGFASVCAELAAPGALERETHVSATQIARIERAAGDIPGVEVYGPAERERRLPHLVCLGIDDVEAEPVLIGLDQAGVAAHSGSSCSSESLEPSPVLEAMGVDAERSLRLSVGWSTTDADIDRVVTALPQVIAELRRLREQP